MNLPLIRWDGPPGYEVAFSTRQGGVSEGPFESLNLGRLTDDEPANVDENRRRLCAGVGADPDRLAMNRQVHAAAVHRAKPGARGRPGANRPQPAHRSRVHQGVVSNLWREQPQRTARAIRCEQMTEF